MRDALARTGDIKTPSRKSKNGLNLLAPHVKVLDDLFYTEPASRFLKMAETGSGVFFSIHAPLTLCGTLSTAEH